MTDLQIIESDIAACNPSHIGGSRPHAAAPEQDPALCLEDSERTRCEVWTRVMGYHRPVSAFNAGKRSEHGERQYFVECSPASADRVERAA